jgi:hypothetical protein
MNNNNKNNKTLIGEINEQTDFLVDPPVAIDPPVADDDVQESEEIKTFKGTGVRCVIQETGQE